MLRLAAILVAGVLASGCFVLDEIDAGQEILKQHSPAEKSDDSAGEEAEKPGLLARARGWLAGLGGDDADTAPEDDSPPPHPENTLVRCDVGGSLQFTRKFDCQLKGGKVLGPMNAARR